MIGQSAWGLVSLHSIGRSEIQQGTGASFKLKIAWFLFTLKASYLVKWPISTWSFIWRCQFIAWLKFETCQSSLFNFGRANWTPLHSSKLPLRITIYLCVIVFTAFAKHSRVPSSAPNTSSRPGRPGNKSALTAPDSTVLPTLMSSVQRSLPRMIAIWPSTRGTTWKNQWHQN